MAAEKEVIISVAYYHAKFLCPKLVAEAIAQMMKRTLALQQMLRLGLWPLYVVVAVAQLRPPLLPSPRHCPSCAYPAHGQTNVMVVVIWS